MKTKYWHTLNIGAQKALTHSKMKYGRFLKIYSQPDWCNYPTALGGGMGCWSLITPGEIRVPESCSLDCPYREVKK